jgi:hypothetical protein
MVKEEKNPPLNRKDDVFLFQVDATPAVFGLVCFLQHFTLDSNGPLIAIFY